MELEVLELRTDHPEQHFKVHFSGLTIKVFSKNIKMHVGIIWNTFPGITIRTLPIGRTLWSGQFRPGSCPVFWWGIPSNGSQLKVDGQNCTLFKYIHFR